MGSPGTIGATRSITPQYDASGNLVDDGQRYIYIYDSRNRLVQVNRRDPGSNSADHVGKVFAKFSYNALGWRTSAIYDLHDATASSHTQLEGFAGAGGGGRSESRGLVEKGGDGQFNDETAEYYTYDAQWRMIAIDRQGPVVTTGPSAGKRPAIRRYQRIIYSPTEVGVFGGRKGGNSDIPLMRLRDTNGDGVYDETLYYLQNDHGDVVAMYQPRVAKPEPGRSLFDLPGPSEARRALVLERYKYGLYGEPDCVQPLDVNGDGFVNVLGNGQAGDLADDGLAFSTAMHAEPVPPEQLGGSMRADVDGDGYLTKWDEEYYVAFYGLHYAAQYDAIQVWNGWDTDVINMGTWDGHGELSRWHEVGSLPDGTPTIRSKHEAWISLDNRLGYAGYVWDPHLKLYHVRHRVYDPREGTWLQEDPIGIAGGLNLHEYCNSDPLSFMDPMGLDSTGTSRHYTINRDGPNSTVTVTTTVVSESLLQVLTLGIFGSSSSSTSTATYNIDQTVPGTGMTGGEFIKFNDTGAVDGVSESARAWEAAKQRANDTGLAEVKLAGQQTVFDAVFLAGIAIGGSAKALLNEFKEIRQAGGKIVGKLKNGNVVELSAEQVKAFEEAKSARAASGAAGEGAACSGAAASSGSADTGLQARFRTGAKGELESAFAKIEPKDIGAGTPTTKAARDLAESLGTATDDAGHAIAKNLGGPGGANSGNIFPQSQNINRGDFRVLEEQIVREVKAGNSVYVRVVPRYTPGSTRPFELTYQVRVNGVTTTFVFPN